MQFLQTVAIKQVFTELKKETLAKGLHEEIEQVQREMDQLHFQLQKAIKGSSSKEFQVRKRYEQEINKRTEKRKSIEFKLQQLQKLEMGTEIADGYAQAIVELNIGDTWPDQGQELEMVVRDGTIEQFRESRRSDDGLV
ncbi:YlqD family protein [Alkalicoccobacillus murimartini]|uniref:CO dehydrogenase/acetyl-CoA synthase delta subunit n=1 Tax=Alkalicoccobacillus murimartini TaxID=171685 RepID=A0ABT9YGP3_9BACI|nr:YlqD family protein [Alkalicoccobacillus murimartini]MDQ0206382.1 CO dehydrogenase/acetyl-CoA synthase delta subunit [Alkalicoccobacillus murimartini]